MVYTDPQAAAVGATEARFSATVPISEVAKTAAYTRAYADAVGYLTLLSDGRTVTGAHALGPEAGSGCSRQPWPCAPASRWRCCATPSSPSRPSPRSTSPPSPTCTTRSPRAARSTDGSLHDAPLPPLRG
ncbi:hypothetical protein KJK32_00575 [Streptomyces sp. JCM17656]|nr:hypothetical protein KJK32_00575 [Streptomyces sp. JCM17656]